MKRLITLASLLIVTALATELNASHVIGGDIQYVHLGASRYKVIYTMYRECKGVPLGAIDFHVSCADSSNKIALTATRTSIKDISVFCSRDTAPCSPQNTATTGGQEEHTFEVTVDFSQSPYSAIKNACCRAIFTASTCCRNGSITNVTPGNFFLEAMVDLCAVGSNGNNSAEFSGRPRMELCCGHPFVYSVGGRETDLTDSISFELSTPLMNLNDPVIYSGNFNAQLPMTPYCPPNPGVINCRALPNAKPPRGIYFNETDGSFVFTPTNCSEVGVVVFRINEWRKDSTGARKLVGYVKRESTWFVRTCADNNPPYFAGNNSYSMCENDRICISISSKDDPFLPVQTIPDTVTLTWDSAIAGAQFRIKDPSAREKEAEFCWQTKAGDAKTDAYRFTVTARDNFCSPPLSAQRTYSIQVKPRARTTVSYRYGFKGKLLFESVPDNIPGYDASNYRYQFFIRDSSNSGIPLYQDYKRADSFTFTQAGRYIIEHQINNPPYHCPTIIRDTITITRAHLSSVTGLSVGILGVFPNPGKGIFRVEAGEEIPADAELTIYSAEGRNMGVIRIRNGMIDLSGFTAGYYLLELKSDERIYRSRLLLQ